MEFRFHTLIKSYQTTALWYDHQLKLWIKLINYLNMLHTIISTGIDEPKQNNKLS